MDWTTPSNENYDGLQVGRFVLVNWFTSGLHSCAIKSTYVQSTKTFVKKKNLRNDKLRSLDTKANRSISIWFTS